MIVVFSTIMVIYQPDILAANYYVDGTKGDDVSGDGSEVAPAGYTPFNIAKDASSPDETFVFAIDTATVGNKSITITIVSDATVSPYTLSVDVTVS